jgi:hypothetical protein
VCITAFRQEIQRAQGLDDADSANAALRSIQRLDDADLENTVEHLPVRNEDSEDVMDDIQPVGEDHNDFIDIQGSRNLVSEPPLEIEPFPSDFAGKPILHVAATEIDCDNYVKFGPFKSLIDWEVAKWIKLRGPSLSALNELLAIEGVSNCVILLYVVWY